MTHTIALDHPWPGTLVFNATPLVARHASGTSARRSTTAIVLGPLATAQPAAAPGGAQAAVATSVRVAMHRREKGAPDGMILL
jgi:hypothetical protein